VDEEEQEEDEKDEKDEDEEAEPDEVQYEVDEDMSCQPLQQNSRLKLNQIVRSQSNGEI